MNFFLITGKKFLSSFQWKKKIKEFKKMIHKTDYFFKTISFLFGVLKTLFWGVKKGSHLY